MLMCVDRKERNEQDERKLVEVYYETFKTAMGGEISFDAEALWKVN